MDIKVNFDNYNHCYINDARIAPMIDGDKKAALHMSVWEKITDFFRTAKKADAYQQLYSLLNSEGCDKLDAFNKLKNLASQEYQQYFTKKISSNDVIFSVGKEDVGQSSLQKLMNVSDETSLHTIPECEETLFLNMLDTLRENVLLHSDSYSGFIRLQMSDKHHNDLLNLYRPEEFVGCETANMVNEEFLDHDEEELLRHLHYTKGTKAPDQFSSIGYKEKDSGVEFTMLHPSISYLMKSYSKSHLDGSSSTELNSQQMDSLNRVYTDYNDNKTDVDKVLNKIYHIHGKTLNISFSGRDTNQIVCYPFENTEYFFQHANSLQDLSDSLDEVYRKWVGSEKR